MSPETIAFILMAGGTWFLAFCKGARIFDISWLWVLSPCWIPLLAFIWAAF